MFAKRYPLIITSLVVVLLLLIITSLCLGRYQIGISELGSVLKSKLFGTELLTDDPFVQSVVWSVRLPRIAMAVIVGAALATAGATSQGIFCNPLVSPHILGVSSGAGFGAALGILLFDDPISVQLMALIWGMVAVSLTKLLSRKGKKNPIYMLVLAGVIVSSLFSALLSLLKYTADTDTDLPEIVFWLLGSLAGTSYEKLAISFPIIIVGIGVLYALRWKINIMSLSDEEAVSLCRNIDVYRNVAIIFSTMITATAISACGVIGWIGLVIPHIGRMLVGSDHRRLIPVCIFIGGSYMLLIDDLARCLTVGEIPLSILTAIIGAPFFAFLLRKTGGLGR